MHTIQLSPHVLGGRVNRHTKKGASLHEGTRLTWHHTKQKNIAPVAGVRIAQFASHAEAATSKITVNIAHIIGPTDISKTRVNIDLKLS